MRTRNDAARTNIEHGGTSVPPTALQADTRRLARGRQSRCVRRHPGRRSGAAVTTPRTVPADLARVQRAASDPAVSAWVAANAGSGKTHVLAQRVIRLLLDGVDPGKILCITFTKAAAANMANRVFDELRRWTALDDDALAASIARLSGRRADAPLRECA